jgi:hypothetical protein
MALRALAETMTGAIHFVPWPKPTHGGQFWLFHTSQFPTRQTIWLPCGSGSRLLRFLPDENEWRDQGFLNFVFYSSVVKIDPVFSFLEMATSPTQQEGCSHEEGDSQGSHDYDKQSAKAMLAQG